MLGGFIGGIFTAWFLTWFGIDEIIIQGVKDLFGWEITEASYYLIFGIMGLGGVVANVAIL